MHGPSYSPFDFYQVEVNLIHGTIAIIESEFEFDLDLNVMLVPCDISLCKCQNSFFVHNGCSDRDIVTSNFKVTPNFRALP